MAHVRLEDHIEAGDEVECDSGMRMRVEEVASGEAVCVWRHHGEVKRSRFPLGALRKVSPPEGPPFVRSASQA